MLRRPNPISVIGLVAAVLISSAATFDTYPRQPGIDALHYTFKVTLRDDTDMISGEATVDFRFVLGSVTELFLDLASVTDATEEKGMRVHGVTSSGRPVQWVHEGDRLRITLDAAPAAGERRQFVVRYDGIPASGFNIGPNNFDERTFFSVNWPNKARQWLPMRTAAAAADDHHAHRRR